MLDGVNCAMIISDKDELWRDTSEGYTEDHAESYPKGSGVHLPIKAYHQMRYELSEEITEWISRKARESGMTDSRYLSALITDLMREEARKEKEKKPVGDKAYTKDGKKVLINERQQFLKDKKAAKKYNDQLRGKTKKVDKSGLW